MYSVMVIEDEAYIRNGLKALIPWEKHGFVIAALVENGFHALEMMTDTHYDVVLTDIRMPRMDGLELVCSMRQRNISSEVIVISGYRNFEYARTAIEYGVRNYLLKPINTGELLKTLSKIRRELDEKYGMTAAHGDSELLQQIKSYVQLHYADEVSMRAVGEYLHYNPTYLGRLFQKETGTSFRDYLHSVRIKQAASLLEEGGRKISDVALTVGYKDFNYFCRMFKKIYQVPPSEYLKK